MSDLLIGLILIVGSAFYAVPFGALAIAAMRGQRSKAHSVKAIWFQLVVWILGLLLGIGAAVRGIQQLISN